MLTWEWVAGDTAPLRAQYLKNGKASSLSGATVTLELYDIDSGVCKVEGLEVEVEAGSDGYLTFSPTADEDADEWIAPGKYYGRFRIVDSLGVIQQLPKRLRQFDIRVWSDIEEQE